MTTLLTFKELSNHLSAWCGIRLTKKRLLKWRSEGLPVIDLGHRTKRYEAEVVQDWILSHAKSTNTAASASDRAFRNHKPNANQSKNESRYRR